MATIALEIDPTSELAANSPLVLTDRTNGWRLLEFEAPAPTLDSQWASSVDTEGARRASSRPENREITARVMVDRSTDALLDAQERILGKKVGKLYREGGTLKLTQASGTTIVFDALEARAVRTYDKAHTRLHLAEYLITFVCLPYGRGVEQDLGDNVEATLPALVFTEAVVAGDVDALGRLVVDEDEAVDQWWLTWGIQAQYYSSSANAALFYEAEGRTALGGAAIAVGPTGASGAGSNVMRQGTLTGTYQAMLSTQATAAGAHLSHVGTFRVWARTQRPTTNTGEVSIAFQWAEGDFRRRTTNASVTYAADEREGSWVLVDLGLVTLRPVTQGTQRWEGRILAKSTVAGDDLDVDYLFLVPVDEGSGIARGIRLYETATSFSARDEFNQTAGALAAKVLPVGGTWAGAGDADDFTVNATSHVAQRTAVSDAAGVGPVTGRVALAGTTTYTNIQVEIEGSYTDAGTGARPQWGVVARYVDASNFLAVEVAEGSLLVYTSVAAAFPVVIREFPAWLNPPGVTSKVVLRVDDQGRVFVWATNGTTITSDPLISFQHADLATGGTLATGKIGFYDLHQVAAATTRTYDNFAASVPTKDATMFASQSLELRHDRVTREDSSGSIWTTVSNYAGDYLRIPASGAEARTVRMIVKGSRNDPDWGADSGIDNISARLFATPRYYEVPD